MIIAVLLYIACAAVAFAMAWKYGTGAVPLDYHGAILDKAGVTLHPAVSGLLLAQYRTLAVAMGGLALAILLIAVFGVTSGAIWARFAAPICTLAFAAPVAAIGRKAEGVTGIRTPWRQAAGVGGAAIVAFALSWI